MLPGTKIGPAEILQMVRRRLWLIAIPPIITLFGALIYSSTLPDMYQADMLIAIDPQKVPNKFVEPTVNYAADRRLDTLTVQVLSRTALREMIETFDLYPEERKTRPIDDVIPVMRDNLRVDLEIPRPRWGQEPQATAFHVRFTYTDPQVAARVTQQIGNRYVEQNRKERGAQAGFTNKFLDDELAKARTKLEEQERKLEAFRERHGKELPTQMTSNMGAIANLNLQAQSLVEAIARDRDRKLMLEALYRQASADPVPVAPVQPTPGGTTPVAATAQQQLEAARASLQVLKQKYKPDHPDVTRAQRLIASLEPKAEEERRQAAAQAGNSPAAAVAVADPVRRETLRQQRAEIESLERQIAFKEAKEREVRDQIAEYQRRVEAVPGLESEWTALTRDYDTQQAAYKELLAKSNAAQVAANLEDQDVGERFRIVDPAAVPVHPVRAIRALVNAGGMAFGLLLGLGCAAFLEIRDKSFRTDVQVVDVLSLPVLALVPRIDTAVERAGRQRRKLAFLLTGAAGLVVASYVTWTLKLWNSLI